MQLIDNPTFLAHAAKQSIALDSRYSEPRTLGYSHRLGMAIPLSDNIHERQKAISTALALFPDEIPVWVWRRGGTWRFRGALDHGPRHDIDRAAHKVFTLAGIDHGQQTTLYLDPGEKDFLYLLTFMNSLAACSVSEDLFIVPDHQGFVLWFDHHDQIIVQCRDQEAYNALAKVLDPELRRLGVPLEPDPP